MNLYWCYGSESSVGVKLWELNNAQRHYLIFHVVNTSQAVSYKYYIRMKRCCLELDYASLMVKIQVSHFFLIS